MDMRLRIPEVLEEHDPPLTPYKLSKASGGRISLSTAYRLAKNRGAVKLFDADLLEALCDVLGLSDTSELFERAPKKGRRG